MAKDLQAYLRDKVDKPFHSQTTRYIYLWCVAFTINPPPGGGGA